MPHYHLTKIGIPIIEISWSHDHLISIMEISIPGQMILILKPVSVWSVLKFIRLDYTYLVRRIPTSCKYFAIAIVERIHLTTCLWKQWIAVCCLRLLWPIMLMVTMVKFVLPIYSLLGVYLEYKETPYLIYLVKHESLDPQSTMNIMYICIYTNTRNHKCTQTNVQTPKCYCKLFPMSTTYFHIS